MCATGRSDKSLCVYRSADKLLQKVARHIGGTNCFVWSTNSVWLDFERLVAVTKFCCWDNNFHITSPEHTICCCSVLPEWVAATCHLVSSDLYCYVVVLVFIIYILSCYDVNFLTQMSSSQSEEQTMSFTHEKRHNLLWMRLTWSYHKLGVEVMNSVRKINMVEIHVFGSL